MARLPRFPSSIRWRLPITYATIALFAAVALGAVLLVTLQRFYAQRELGHLDRNSQTISASVAQLLEADLPAGTLRTQLEYFAFLAQARVRVFDANGALLAETGVPQSISVAVVAEPASDAGGAPTYTPVLQIASDRRALFRGPVDAADRLPAPVERVPNAFQRDTEQLRTQAEQTFSAIRQEMEQTTSIHAEADALIDSLTAQLAHDGGWSPLANELAAQARELLLDAHSQLDSTQTHIRTLNETLGRARDQLNQTQAEGNFLSALRGLTQAQLSEAQSQITDEYSALSETWLQHQAARLAHNQIVRRFNAALSAAGGSLPVDRINPVAPAEPLTPLTPQEPIAPLPQGRVAFENGTVVFSQDIAVNGSAFGFDLNPEASSSGQRSTQRVTQSVYGSAGALLGSVTLSDGPAYGRDILDNIARGWGLAGVIAVSLAAGAGWLVSRRITRPILSLTEVTTRMAGGALSARANVAGDDEVGSLARSFNTMADRVEDTVTTLRRFAADAAHELKTPLTALRVDLDMILDTADSAPDTDALRRAQEQIKRLDALTTGLLDLSRIESGLDDAAKAPVDLGALLKDVVVTHASRAEQAGLSLSVDVPEDDVTVYGDESQLRRAVDNLLDNALKFTPEGGTVRVGLMREPGGCTVSIEDTGVGIPAKDVPQLFNRFHRGRNVSAYPGNGLGLALVKAIVENHDGQVSAENTARGARVRVRLPVMIAHIPR